MSGGHVPHTPFESNNSPLLPSHRFTLTVSHIMILTCQFCAKEFNKGEHLRVGHRPFRPQQLLMLTRSPET